jgi:Putative transposase of IS4/5 family (DUF4096)
MCAARLFTPLSLARGMVGARVVRGSTVAISVRVFLHAASLSPRRCMPCCSPSEGVLKITALKRCDPTITHDVPLAMAPCSPYYDALWPCTWEVYEAAHTRPRVQRSPIPCSPVSAGSLYPCDLTDAAWAQLEPLLPGPARRGRPRVWPLRLLVNALFSVLRTGCAWRSLPREYPPWQTP